jgi:tRNA modification GTPase
MSLTNSVDTSRTTIAALASAPAPAGVAVIRISGSLVRRALHALFRSSKDPCDTPRKLILGEIIDFKTGESIDKALAVFMPGPSSFTGEDVAELQCHGSPLLAQKILRSLFAFGVSPARAGEFTERAFLNGKIDLIQAEAIASLIEASSERELKIANEHLEGKLSTTIDAIGEPLRNILAEIEATIDFPEEEISPESVTVLSQKIVGALNTIRSLLATFDYGRVVSEGFRVLLCGRPNVGKSSLLNALVGEDRAIVTEISGTTRDIIEVEARFGGYRFVFCDSAGITETTDPVEQIGILKARQRFVWADLILLLVDATRPESDYAPLLAELHAAEKPIWMVINKVDINPHAIGTLFCDSTICIRNLYLSATTTQGVNELTQALREEIESRNIDGASSSATITNERQRDALEHAASLLDAAHQGAKNFAPLEIIAEDVRQSLKSLEELIGKTYTEDLLGRIFSKFCIGK